MLALAAVSAALLTSATPQGQDFRWRGLVPRGQTIEVQGIIGGITAEPARGDSVEVVATSHPGYHGSAGAVTFKVLTHQDGVTICVIYPRHRSDRGEWNRRWGGRCADERREAPFADDENDTRVDFVVRVPRGVRFLGQTVTADVTVRGLRGDVEGYTIAGDVLLSEVEAEVVDAASLSGDITLHHVSARQVYLGTMSGAITFDGPIHRGGLYDFLTWSGRIHVVLPGRSAFDLSVFQTDSSPRIAVAGLSVRLERRHRYRGRLGAGGASLQLEALNGEVEIE